MVAQVPDLLGSDAYTAPWVTDPPPPPDPMSPTPAPVPFGAKYEPAVERWRPGLMAEFAKQGVPTVDSRGNDLIDKSLHVLTYESHGDDTATGDGGAAYGGFQSHYVPKGADMATQIADAVGLIKRNPDMWTDWGEGSTYQGQPFGALGRVPYGSAPPTGSALGGFFGNAIKSRATIPTTDSSYVPSDQPLSGQAGRPVGGFRDTELQPDPNATTSDPLDLASRGINAIGNGIKTGYDAAANAASSIGPGALMGDGRDQVEDPLASATALQAKAEQLTRDRRLQYLHDQAMKAGGGTIDPKTGKIVPGGLGAAVAGAVVPDNFADIALAAEPFKEGIANKGKALIKTGLPEAPAFGSAEFHAGVGGGSPFDAQSQLDAMAAEDAAKAEANKPKPGQGGLFGGKVDETGKLTAPEMPAHPSAESLRPATEFRGESGGQQIPAFTREETGQTGQMDLAESLTPKAPDSFPAGAKEQSALDQLQWLKDHPDDPRLSEMGVRYAKVMKPEIVAQELADAPYFTPGDSRSVSRWMTEKGQEAFGAGIPDVAAEQAKPTPLPAANGLERDQRMVRAGDLQFRPDLFQARDTTEGLPFGEGRVKQIAENWNDAKFTPPDAVPDPENPGKFIVTSGHHRTEAFIRNFGEDAPIPTTITHADLNNPEHLSQMQSLARSANFDTAEANFREKVRVAQNARSPEAAAQELRLTPSKVEELHDAARVGKQAIDRVVSEPALQPYITEIGRGVRVHGITEEDANGLFNRIADGTKVSRPTPTALRETIDKFGAILGDERFKAAQGSGMFGDEAGGSKGGLLQLIDENARTRTQLTKDIAVTRRAMRDAGRLAEGGAAADKKAAERLVSLGSAKVKEAQSALARNEANLGRAARGEDLPEPAPKAPARPKSEPQVMSEEQYLTRGGASALEMGDAALSKNIGTGAPRRSVLAHQDAKDADLVARRAVLRAEYDAKVAAGELRAPTSTEQAIATAQGMDENPSVQAARRLLDKRGIDWRTPETASPRASTGAPASAPPPEGTAPPAAPPRTPPPRSAPLGEEPVDQLIANVEAAASMKPDLAARRTEERAKRFDAMFQKLIAGGAEPRNAFKEARTELGGQLADPSFVVPGDLDHNALHQYIIDAVTRKEVPLMTGNAADEGLKKLAEGFVPANHEIRDLGQVFGPRLQQAIEDMGTILNVQSRVEASLLREPIQITFPDGTAITPEKLGDLLRERLPGTDKDMLGKVAERLIDEEKIKVSAGKGGKKVLTVGEAGSGDNIVRMGGSGFENGVPHQEVPPASPKFGEDSFQPSTVLAPDISIGPSPRTPSEAELTNARLRGTAIQKGAPIGEGIPGEVQPAQAPKWGGTESPPLSPAFEKALAPVESKLHLGGRTLVSLLMSPVRVVTLDHLGLARQAIDLAAPGPGLSRRQMLQDIFTVYKHPQAAAGLEEALDRQPYMKAAIDAHWIQSGAEREAKRLPPTIVDKVINTIPGSLNASEATRYAQTVLVKGRYEAQAAGMARLGITEPRAFKDTLDVLQDAAGQGLRGKSLSAGGISPTMAPGALVGRLRSITDVLVNTNSMPEEAKGLHFTTGSWNPMGYGARPIILRHLLVAGGIALAVDELGKAAGGSLDWNLLNTPLGKVQFGPSAIDGSAGYNTLIRMAAKVTDAVGRGDLPKVKDAIGNYLRGQLGPVNDALVSAWLGSDWQGKHYNLIDKAESGKLITDLYTPIAAKALMDAVQVHGLIKGALLGAPSLIAMGSETNLLTASRDKAVAAMNQTDPTTGKPISTYADAGPTLRHAVDQSPEVVKAQGGPSAYQDAKLASLKPALDERDRQEALHEQGKNTQKLSDTYHTLNDKRQQSAHDLEPQFASTFANFNKDKYSKAVEDYYASPKTIPEGQDNAGGIDFEATAADRQDKLAKMAPDVQEWVRQALAVTEGNKSATERQYDAMIAMKKQVGYFDPGADTKALDRQYPALDVASWKNNSTSTKASEMNSTAAVEMALADPYSKVLPVKFTGLAIPINESPQTEAAFKEYGKRAQNYEEGYVNDPRWKPIWDVERAKHSQETYGKPFAQLADWQKTKVTDWLKSETRTVSRDNAPDLDAYLAWAGNGSRTIAGNQAAVDALQALRKKYGKELPSKDGKPITFK